MNLRSFWELLKETFSEWSEDKASRLAAALSYYTVFSLAPLLVIAIAVAGRIAGQQAVQDEIVRQVQGLLGGEGAELVLTMLESARKPGASILATIVGIITLLFGAMGVFGQLQDALNTIWDVTPKPGRGILGMIKDRFLSFTMVLGTGFLLLVSLVISAALSALTNFLGGVWSNLTIVGQIVNLIVSLGVFTVLFALIYKIVPDVEVQWRDVWIGAAVTALLFTIGKFLIGLYLGYSSVSSAYGAAGSLAILLIWIYYSAQILFLGAEFTQVYAKKYGSQIVPAENAMFITEEARAIQGIPHKAALEGMQEQEKQEAPEPGRRQASQVAGLLPARLPPRESSFTRQEGKKLSVPRLALISLGAVLGLAFAIVGLRKRS